MLISIETNIRCDFPGGGGGGGGGVRPPISPLDWHMESLSCHCFTKQK